MSFSCGSKPGIRSMWSDWASVMARNLELEPCEVTGFSYCSKCRNRPMWNYLASVMVLKLELDPCKVIEFGSSKRIIRHMIESGYGFNLELDPCEVIKFSYGSKCRIRPMLNDWASVVVLNL